MERQMSKPRIGVVMSTTRPGRFADKAATWLMHQGAKHPKLDFEVVDLRNFPLPFYAEGAPPIFASGPSDVTREFSAKIAAQDGFIFVTAEYNRAPTAALKNALDHTYHEWCRKPAAYFGYGGLGAARAVEHLRLMCVELQMVPLRNGVHLAGEDFRLAARGERAIDSYTYLGGYLATALDELAWWAVLLKSARAQIQRGH
jgi:NAD(P)H-dependent FMN reductase